MKTFAKISLVAALAFSAASCNQEFKTDLQTKGTLSFADFTIKTEIETEIVVKGSESTPDDYQITITDTEGEVVFESTYSEVKKTGYGVELEQGNYILNVFSGVPQKAAFESPEYGASEKFSIKAGATTRLAEIVCKVLQVGVKILYDEQLLAAMTGDGVAKVEVMKGFPLEYKLKYNGGKPSYETRTGYFLVADGSNSIMITFDGSINGNTQRMSKMYFGIKGGELRDIVITSKMSPEGTATIDIVTDGYIEDSELGAEMQVARLEVIGEDPDAPKGDGGIKLEFAPGCVMFDDLSNIRVPRIEESPMDLRLIETIPNGAKKMNVRIQSTSETFMAAVKAAGGPELNLINPSPESAVIFDVVPFPHGPELIGMTSIYFDLCSAQEPILAYSGKHSFTIQVTDAKGCRKDDTIVMIVR